MRVRYVLLGLGGLALAIVVGLLIALGLRAITGGTTTSGAAPSAPAPAAATPSSAEPVPSVPARPDPGMNECVDALGDGVVDLDSVRLDLDDGDLVVRFTLAADLPTGKSGLGLYVERSGDKAYEFGVDLRDGTVDRVFVNDLDKSKVDELDDYDVSAEGGVVTAVFPKSAIKRLGTDWSWYATATAPGSVLDACPGTAADPVLLQFER